MKDQVDALLVHGHSAARLDSTLSPEQTQAVLESASSGSLKLLYVSPERFLNETFLLRLKKIPLALLAIDESHCISEWGHNFRPEYLRLAKIAKKLRVPRVLALTATATPPVVKEILSLFRISPRHFIQTPFHRPNLSITITPTLASQRIELLTARLTSLRPFPAVIYATFQETTESLAAHLCRSGIRARPYHAGLSDEVRSSTQDSFMRNETDVVVATIAFGMGIDKSDIRSVFHFNLPKTLENYQQEIGRSGRDGLPAYCETFACADDLIPLQNFIHGDTPDELSIRSLVDHLLRCGNPFDISRYELSRSSDIRPLVLETILTYLELDGIIEPIGSFYSSYKIGFHHSQERILAGHTPKRQQFLSRLFASGKRGYRWLTIELSEAAEATDQPKERILKALRYLEEAGDIELVPSHARHQFRHLATESTLSPHTIASQLHARFLQREERELERLSQVLDLLTQPSCTTNLLLRHFGETPTQPCGHCGNCSHPPAAAIELPASPPAEISIENLRTIYDLQNARLPALRTPRQLARFLCGITSPASTRDRLTRRDEFGIFRSLSFRSVLAQTSSLSSRPFSS